MIALQLVPVRHVPERPAPADGEMYHDVTRVGIATLTSAGTDNRVKEFIMNAPRLVSCLLLAIMLTGVAQAQSPAGWWRFEQTPADGKVHASAGPAAATNPVATIETVSGAKVTTSPDVPGPFIYDPITARSYPNKASLDLSGGTSNASDIGSAHLSIPSGQLGDIESFTLEMFVKPTAEFHEPLAMKSRANDQSAELAIHPRFLSQWKQTYWGAAVTPPKAGKQHWHVGSYVSIGRLHAGTLGWRHVALVYDAKARSVTFWLDHHLEASQVLENPLKLDDAPWLVGRMTKGGLVGFVDELRITPAALDVTLMLRARADAISDVKFDSQATLLPAEIGYYDVKRHFGAVGDGKTDDTAAFQAAMERLNNHIPLAFNTLYVPPGEYLVKDTLAWSRYLVLHGAGPERTIIRLADKAAGFGDPAKPKPLLKCSNFNGTGRGSGSAMANYAYEITLDTGSGNPGAIGFQYHTNNTGRVENLVIRSGDGHGVAGLDLTLPWPGPGLIKHMRIEGFDHGVLTSHREYSMVFEHLTLKNQKKTGILNRGNICSIRKLTSQNTVPAIRNEQAGGMIVLLDAELTGGANNAYAIDNAGALYARNVKTAGYRGAVHSHVVDEKQKVDRRANVEEADVKEFVAGDIHAPFGGSKSSLGLPIMETPDPVEVPIDQWVNVRKYENKVANGDWTAAIQAAVDSDAQVIYFPAAGKYTVAGTIEIKRPVRLVGMKNEISPGPGDKSPANPPQGNDAQKPTFRISGDFTGIVMADRLSLGHVEHTGPSTLVVKSGGMASYVTAPGVGPLFLEDVGHGGWHFANGQKIWARQFNPESRAPAVEITNTGAQLWILGLKTEYASINLINTGGARTEILGGLIYPVQKVEPDLPMFRNTDAWLSIVIAESIYAFPNHKVIVEDRQGEQKVDFDTLDWSGGRAKIPLYVSRPE